jgi:quinol monooxygenase YgiN
MLIVQVQVQVKPEYVESFLAATLENARQSVQEAGVARFEILQHSDDPSRFVFIEGYRDAEAPLRHKETAHYQVWRDAVAPMMAQPRQSTRFQNIYPPDSHFA